MILCCGEALIDMIPEPTQSGKNGFVPHSGGAIFNTAIGLGRLGARVGLLTGMSRDMFGAHLREDLQASNVDSSHVILSDRPTTLAFVKIENGQANYSFVDENSAGRMIEAADLPPLADEVSTLYFGGISLACEPCAEAYEALLLAEADRRTIMIDPNIRSSFVQDEHRYRSRLDRMIAAADIVKVSDEDLNWLHQGAGDIEEKAKDLLSKGPSLVILTKGKDGAVAFSQNGVTVGVNSASATVVDTVGAGDTFNAGVLAQLAKSGGLTKSKIAEISPSVIEQALHFGAKVAGITVSRSGANPPWAHEL